MPKIKTISRVIYMEGFTEKLLDVLLAVIIFFALIGVIIGATNGTLDWGAVNISGTLYDLSWVPYVLVLIIVVSAVVLVVKYMRGKHK